MAIVLPHAKIKAALMQVTDAFCATEVVYKTPSTANFDRFNEAQKTGGGWNTHTIKALIEFGKDANNVELQGAAFWQKVKLTINADEFKSIGLYVDGVLTAKSERDVLTVNGKQYKVTNIMPDGAFQTQNILIIVYGELITQSKQ